MTHLDQQFETMKRMALFEAFSSQFQSLTDIRGLVAGNQSCRSIEEYYIPSRAGVSTLQDIPGDDGILFRAPATEILDRSMGQTQILRTHQNFHRLFISPHVEEDAGTTEAHLI